MSIQVNDFRWEPGENDAEYIRLLESSRDEWQKIAQNAVAKLKRLSKAQEPRVLTLDEAKEALRNDPVICLEGDGKMIYGLRMDGTDYFTMQTDEVMNIDNLDNEEFAAWYGTAFRMWKR